MARRSLLEAGHEGLQVPALLHDARDEMQVVRHDAVAEHAASVVRRARVERGNEQVRQTVADEKGLPVLRANGVTDRLPRDAVMVRREAVRTSPRVFEFAPFHVRPP